VEPGTKVNPLGGNDMKKLLAAIVAAVFAAVTVTPVALAADTKDEGKKVQKKGEGTKKSEGKKGTPKKKGEGKKKAEEKK
jgi:Ni/Co efflux regulator RcnB